ncbi:MAG: PASTA domain-containing protein [Gemmatimonadota bacterium]
MSYRRRRGLGGRRKDEADGADQASPEQRQRETRGAGGAGSKRALISAFAIGGALLVGYGIAALWLFPSTASADDASVVKVPDIVGLFEAEARERIIDAGLEFTVRAGMTHREAPEGAILAQSPLPGQFARPGAPVEATLSRGPEIHTLPDIVGLSERQARIVLERLGYEVEVERAEHPIPAGRAIDTRPGAGTELTVPSRLVLRVSEGAPIVVVPDMLGMHIDDAVDILTGATLELGSISFDPDAAEAPGRIVGQYPPVGYSLRAGDAVELRVAGDRDRLNAGERNGREDEDEDEEPGLL